MNIREWLQRLFGRKSSKRIATERLKQVLIQDRVQASPWFFARVEEELIKAVSTYVEIREGSSRVHLSNHDGTAVLEASFVVTSLKRGREDTNV